MNLNDLNDLSNLNNHNNQNDFDANTNPFDMTLDDLNMNLDTYIQHVNSYMKQSPVISVILVGSCMYRNNTDTFDKYGDIKMGKNHEYPDIIHSLQTRFPDTRIEVACVDPQYQNNNNLSNTYTMPDEPLGLAKLDTNFDGIYRNKLSNFYIIPQYFTKKECSQINVLARNMTSFGSIILFFDFSGNKWNMIKPKKNLYKAPSNCLANVSEALYNPVIEMIKIHVEDTEGTGGDEGAEDAEGAESNKNNDRHIFNIYNPINFGQIVSDFQVWQKIIETMPTKDRTRLMMLNGKGNIALKKLRFIAQKISISIGNLSHSHLKILKILDIIHNFQLYPYLKNGFRLDNPDLDSVIAYIIWKAGNTSYKIHLICNLLEKWKNSKISELQFFINGELNRHLMVVLRVKYKDKMCNHLDEVEYKNHNECQKKIQNLENYFENLW